MKKSGASQGPSASELISKRIAELGDWRGDTLSRMRKLIKEADPDVVEEWKWRSEEHTSELQSRGHLVCRLLLEKKQCGFTLLGCPRLLTHEPPAAVLSATEVATLLTLAHTGGDAGPGYAHADLIAPTDVLPLCL